MRKRKASDELESQPKRRETQPRALVPGPEHGYELKWETGEVIAYPGQPTRVEKVRLLDRDKFAQLSWSLRQWLWTDRRLKDFIRRALWLLAAPGPRLYLSGSLNLLGQTGSPFNVFEFLRFWCRWTYGDDSFRSFYSETTPEPDWCQLTLSPCVRVVHLRVHKGRTEEWVEHVCAHIHRVSTAGIIITRYDWALYPIHLDSHVNQLHLGSDIRPWSLVRTSWGATQVVDWMMQERNDELRLVAWIDGCVPVPGVRNIVISYL
jgi:hypothetical protein